MPYGFLSFPKKKPLICWLTQAFKNVDITIDNTNIQIIFAALYIRHRFKEIWLIPNQHDYKSS